MAGFSMDNLRAKIRHGSGISIDSSSLRYEWVEGGSNGLQTFFMTAEELESLYEKSMKKFGRVNPRTGKTEKWIKDHWEVISVDDDIDEMEEMYDE